MVPQGAPEEDSIPSGPGARPMWWDSGPPAPRALRGSLPAPSPVSLQSKDSKPVPRVGSRMEEPSSIMVRPGGVPEAKTLPPRLERKGSPDQLVPIARDYLASWDESLVTAHRGPPPGTKTSAREGGPGCSLTLPKVRVPSTFHDSVQLARRHHSQPQVGPGHFNHMVSFEIGTLSAPHPSGLPDVTTLVELQEEPEKMEMDEQLLDGRKEEKEGPMAPGAELEEVDLGSKPPTPPLHRFPSWVRGHLEAGQS